MPRKAAPTKTRQELVLWIKKLIAEDRMDEFYTSWEWRKLSGQVRAMDHNECQICKAKGRYKRADSAHHRMEVKKYPELALSIWYTDEHGDLQRNIIAICESCHAEVHDRYKRWQQGRRYHKQGHTNEEWW